MNEIENYYLRMFQVWLNDGSGSCLNSWTKFNLEFPTCLSIIQLPWNPVSFLIFEYSSGVRTTVNISDSAELSAQELDKNTENLANAYMCSRLRSSCSLINQTSRSYGSLNPYMLVFIFILKSRMGIYFWNNTTIKL